MRTSVLSPARLCWHRLLFALCVLILTAALFGCVVQGDDDFGFSGRIFDAQGVMNVVPQDCHIRFAYTPERLTGDALVYQWYTSADGSPSGTALFSEDDATFITPRYTAKGIYFYFCVATDRRTGETETSPVYSVAYTGLPTVYLNTTTTASAITRTAYVQGDISILSPAHGVFSYVFRTADEGIKGRGNSSWGMPKKSYNIKFDTTQKIFGLPKAKKWCMTANYADKSLLRNKFASVLGTALYDAEWNPSFVSVDVVMNGEYVGNYLFCEKNTLTDGRIEAADISETEDGGFVLEIDVRYDAAFYFTTTRGVPITLKDPDDVSEETRTRIKTIVQTAEDALYGEDFADTLTDGEEQSKWMQYLDIDSFVDWYLVNEFAKNVDAPFWLSVYMYYDPHDRKLHLSPNWDFDIGFGNANYTNDGNTTSCADPTGWYIKIAKVGSTINWISRLFKDPRFVAKVKSRWNEKKAALSDAINNAGAFSRAGIQSLADGISVSADYNFMRWQILGIYVWPNAAGYETRTTYQSEVDYLIDWCNARFAWLDGAINGL